MAMLSATVIVGNVAAFWWTKRKPAERARAGVMSKPRARKAISAATTMITVVPTLWSRSAMVRVCCSRNCPARVGDLAVWTNCPVTARSTRISTTARTAMTTSRMPMRPALSDNCEKDSLINTKRRKYTTRMTGRKAPRRGRLEFLEKVRQS